MNNDETIVSLDVEARFTNVPLDETNEDNVSPSYRNDSLEPEFCRSTFRTLLQLVTKDVVLLAHRGPEKVFFTRTFFCSSSFLHAMKLRKKHFAQFPTV